MDRHDFSVVEANGMNPTTPPDESAIHALIALCLAGEQAAYAALYDMVAPGLYRLSYSILLN